MRECCGSQSRTPGTGRKSAIGLVQPFSRIKKCARRCPLLGERKQVREDVKLNARDRNAPREGGKDEEKF